MKEKHWLKVAYKVKRYKRDMISLLILYLYLKVKIKYPLVISKLDLKILISMLYQIYQIEPQGKEVGLDSKNLEIDNKIQIWRAIYQKVKISYQNQNLILNKINLQTLLISPH